MARLLTLMIFLGVAASLAPERVCTAQDSTEMALVVRYSDVSEPESGELLAKIATRINRNYRKIKTWSGTFQVQDRQRHDSVESYRDLLVEDVEPPILRRDSGEFSFDLDVPGSRLAVDYRTLNPQFSEISSGKEFVLREFKPEIATGDGGNSNGNGQPGVDARGFFQQSIVKLDEFLNFEPYMVFGDFAGVPKTGIVGRVAFIDSVEKASHQSWGIIPDPRSYFGDVVPYFEEIQQMSRSFNEPISGSFTEAQRKLLLDSIRVSRGAGENAHLYKISMKSQNGLVEIGRVCDERFEFNPILAWVGDPGGNGFPGVRTSIHYKFEDGVAVPDRVVRIVTKKKDEIKFQRTVVLVDSHLNKPIPEDRFSVARFGLKEGERLVNRIDGTIKQMRDGRLVDATKFDVRAPVKGRSISILQFTVFLNLLVLLVLFLVFVCRKAMAIKNTYSSGGS